MFNLCEFYEQHVNVRINGYDLRSYKKKKTKGGRFVLKQIVLEAPPNGFIEIDLKNNSELDELDY